jgi:hypothetical protein
VKRRAKKREVCGTGDEGELVSGLDEGGALHAVLDALQAGLEFVRELLAVAVHLLLETDRERLQGVGQRVELPHQRQISVHEGIVGVLADG